jgi:hypothetical protein
MQMGMRSICINRRPPHLNTSLCGRYSTSLRNPPRAWNSFAFIMHCGSCQRIYKSKAAKEVLDG